MPLNLLLSMSFILFATFAISVTIWFAIRRAEARFRLTNRLWDDAFLNALSVPLQCAVWLWGISFALFIALPFMKWTHFTPQLLVTARESISAFLLAWFLYRYIRALDQNYHLHIKKYAQKIDKTTVQALVKISKILLLFFTALFALKYFFNMSLTGIWTLTGAGSLIVGLAAKDMLANFFGGLMIYFNRPFSIGDMVRSPDKEIEGVVEQIGWRATSIRTLEATAIYVPNAVFSNITVENLSRRTHRRMFETIDLQYSDINKLNNIVSEVSAMLKAHPQIDKEKMFFASLLEMGSMQVSLRIVAYIPEPDFPTFMAARQAILLKVADIFRKNDAELPTNTYFVRLENPEAAS